MFLSFFPFGQSAFPSQIGHALLDDWGLIRIREEPPQPCELARARKARLPLINSQQLNHNTTQHNIRATTTAEPTQCSPSWQTNCWNKYENMPRARLFVVTSAAFPREANPEKDFEGQRLAEFLATFLLGAVGVSLHMVNVWIQRLT